ncbi:carbohydrate ABC transporter permease [Phytoactinopolyspora mesophila]|uniref:ABC transporter permease subunit n=1 Tax=Phytoactinopolyspora mesophila TaxID=2650750 RepID=A0A7K3M0Q1_9ACTN|nr:sugar ABC transporter permease [Phytoactinopolyspora mesophila]NDL56830.1 ABC transporter permease subunit [Phytoactinopolyspora mesophila]
MHTGKYRLIGTFLAAPLLFYAVFVLWPYLQAFRVSMTDWGGLSAERNFVGLDNFVRLLSDPVWWRALSHNMIFLIVWPLIVMTLALFFASILNISGGSRGIGGIRGAGFYRIVYFFPHILPAVMAAVLWQFVFNPRMGILNGTLDAVGLGALQRSWLGNPDTALWAIMGVVVWGAVGFYVVLFSAAMSAIPHEYFEAAQLDGAGAFRTFWKVTLPMMWGTVQVAYVYLGMAALDLFAIAAVLTPRGGPDGSTEVVATYLYRTAFERGEFGYASAIGVALCLITVVFAAVAFRLSRRERIEY